MLSSPYAPVSALLLLGAAFTPASASAAGYTLSWLGVESGYINSAAEDVNNDGEVVGNSYIVSC